MTHADERGRERAGIDGLEASGGRIARRNSDESLADYAASRINQGRKSSSAPRTLKSLAFARCCFRRSTRGIGFRFGKQLVERRAIEITAVCHDSLDTLRMMDVLERIGIEQDEIRQLA